MTHCADPSQITHVSVSLCSDTFSPPRRRHNLLRHTSPLHTHYSQSGARQTPQTHIHSNFTLAGEPLGARDDVVAIIWWSILSISISALPLAIIGWVDRY